MVKLGSLLVFLVLVVGGGIAIGIVTAPGAWYTALVKPSFNPPNWVFAPVWTVLYVLIAMAGWRLWRRDRLGWPTILWWGQLALNFLWSPVFFSMHRVDAALGVILLLFAATVGVIVTSWRHDRVTSWLFLPYALWVGFAAVLNGAILRLN